MEALPPAYDPGVPSAMPIIQHKNIPSLDGESNAFRFKGFGKYRKEQYGKTKSKKSA